jgi:hypothetical protein
MFMSFFLKSALIAPLSCGLSVFLKLWHPLNQELCLIHVMNVLCVYNMKLMAAG